MKFNLEWFKKHPAAAGAAILVGLLVVFVLFRKGGSSSGGFASLAAGQQAGDLQLAELNAQQSAQQDQLNAQVGLSEYQTEASVQSAQDQLAAQLVSGVVPLQLRAQQQTTLLPLEEEALALGKNPKLAQESELLLSELMGGGGSISTKYGTTTALPSNPSLLNNMGTGLFG